MVTGSSAAVPTALVGYTCGGKTRGIGTFTANIHVQCLSCRGAAQNTFGISALATGIECGCGLGSRTSLGTPYLKFYGVGGRNHHHSLLGAGVLEIVYNSAAWATGVESGVAVNNGGIAHHRVGIVGIVEPSDTGGQCYGIARAHHLGIDVDSYSSLRDNTSSAGCCNCESGM